MVVAVCLVSSAAYADIEAVSATIKGTVSKVQTEYKKAQDMLESANKLKDSATQGFDKVKNNIDGIKNMATNPASLVSTSVLGGMKDKIDGSVTEDVGIENVKSTYNRTYGELNNITKAKKLRASINKEQGESLARLYARTLVMRQDLAAEKDPDYALDTISDALTASGAMQLQSLRRWNKILEMQAYINNYKNAVAIQNFVNKNEDTEGGANE